MLGCSNMGKGITGIIDYNKPAYVATSVGSIVYRMWDIREERGNEKVGNHLGSCECLLPQGREVFLIWFVFFHFQFLIFSKLSKYFQFLSET